VHDGIGIWLAARRGPTRCASYGLAVAPKGIPTAGLLAMSLAAEHADFLPLYRQEAIVVRAGFAIPRATLGAWSALGIGAFPEL
jgi:transposase